MSRPLLILIFTNVYIMDSNSRILVGDCEITKTDICAKCDMESTDFCSLSAVFRLTRNVNLDSRKYTYSWYLNGTEMMNVIVPKNTIFKEYTGSQEVLPCNNTSICAVEIHIHLSIPKPSSRLKTNGNYTIRFLYVHDIKSLPDEEMSCSTLVCVRTKPGLASNDIDKGDVILIQAVYFYILAGVALLIFIIVIVLVCLTVRLCRKTKRIQLRNYTQRQISDGAISMDESTAVSNHTYASVQRNGTLSYQTLHGRNPSIHRYDEPAGSSVFVDNRTETDEENNRNRIRRQHSNFDNTINARISRLGSLSENIPDIIELNSRSKDANVQVFTEADDSV